MHNLQLTARYRVIVLEWHVFACAQLNSQSNQNKRPIHATLPNVTLSLDFSEVEHVLPIGGVLNVGGEPSLPGREIDEGAWLAVLVFSISGLVSRAG